ncbi:MAG: hypothetical protein R3C61_17190 [Bacteroidia bacterium]
MSSCSGPARNATADAVILLWMGGGMAHTETFDPKAYAPFEKGMESKRVLSTFPSVPTIVDGLHFSKDWKTSVRSWTKAQSSVLSRAADLGFILHTRHQYHWHTCYEPPQPIQPPHLQVDNPKNWAPKTPRSFY